MTRLYYGEKMYRAIVKYDNGLVSSSFNFGATDDEFAINEIKRRVAGQKNFCIATITTPDAETLYVY